MPHITRDVEALLERLPSSVTELRTGLEELRRWSVLNANENPDAAGEVRAAIEAVLELGDADAVPIPEIGGWSIAWHSRSWVLRGIVYPEPTPAWSPRLDKRSPVALVARHDDAVILGDEVVRLAHLVLGQALVTRWLRAAAPQAS